MTNAAVFSIKNYINVEEDFAFVDNQGSEYSLPKLCELTEEEYQIIQLFKENFSNWKDSREVLFCALKTANLTAVPKCKFTCYMIIIYIIYII